jgi:hypothetical protein
VQKIVGMAVLPVLPLIVFVVPLDESIIRGVKKLLHV